MTSPVSPSNTKIISAAIEKLRSFCQANILPHWRCFAGDLPVTDVSASLLSEWTPAQINAKGYIVWAGGQKVLWLAQKLVIPQDLEGYALRGLSLRLALVWWANSVKIYVNGELVGEGDLFDSSPRILVSQAVTPGEEFFIAIRLVSPGHCDGALVRSLLIYESNEQECPDPGFVADELAVTQRFLERFAPESLDRLAVVVEEVMNRQDAKDAKEERGEFDRRLLSLRNHLLQSKIENPKFKIYLLGHAHLDMAWLWRVSETWEAAQSTFESVLQLQVDFSELVFCHSTPALYAWVEENRPDLFRAIQEKVVAGSWEVVGGFWVEPELNLIAGESIVRQLLYGQRYVQEKFGKLVSVVWVPDTFGFCATLPQFMEQGGIEYFVTQKLRWNDTTKFPYGAFWWCSPDGSKILSLMSAPVGEGIDPVKMADYAIEWQTQTGFTDSLWLPGVGDHGGGPTRDMLETAQRWQKSPLFPELEFTTAEKYLQHLQSIINSHTPPLREAATRLHTLPTSPHSPLPTWDDELYLEFHRGCYTTHGDQKRWNRRCENLLYQAELFAAIATLKCGVNYPRAELETAWKQVLFNQFHDILPGSSITEVYEDALSQWQEVEKVGTGILEQSLRAIAARISLPTPPQPDSLPVVVFNSLNWQRSEVITVPLPSTTAPNQVWQIYDHSGNQIVSQLGEASTLLFLARDIPPVGYRVFWLCPSLPKNSHNTTQSDDTNLSLQKQEQFSPERLTLENEFLRVIIDEQNGNLSSVFDKVNNREVLNQAGGNLLQAFQDSGQYWDAWNIDPNYAQHPLPPATLQSIQWLEQGPVQHRLRVVQQLGESEFCCDYILSANSPMLKIAMKVDWQQEHVLVKAAFPLNLEADFATYEIPCGAIRRPTKPQTPAEKAKWEVPALRWADLTEEVEDMGDKGELFTNPQSLIQNPKSKIHNPYGVSLLNDCKYGYDAQPHQLRLTLLRSPNWPDPKADRGVHEFTYALYPHAGDWKSAHTVRRGSELNVPLQVIVCPANPPLSMNGDGLEASFLDLSAENLILMSLKQAEDDPHKWILRFYECHGETADLSLQNNLGLSLEESVDLLERPFSTSEFSSTAIDQKLTIKPWKIINLKLQVSDSATA
ncbi:alpha-mannosidase [Fischerella thermalis]|uniref:alpha-mannosidase n=6 Tax=Fischerella thermalis TaxID=372787 RepID=UPI000C7F86BD|nr:alpha-mannosidase [Fischerella thermalis]PLZ17252.1 alpha-mannosidase [Fischerella thermalis WC1110]PLZ28693.1 alpha-mannosidase [Fischerella thermalis WC559]PLZ30529.1 alpha-mannosidase [Fischerella thermalis WC558]PLZ35530.1 alpha-mannosidase [Fischerella thermalis WC542]PLZ46642.1 alpha-mannosidase [Fischerella thermalis WC527]